MIRTSINARRSAGYSLDHAARIRQAIEAGTVGVCPQCDFPLEATIGKDGERDVWLVRCPGCGRSLVMRARPRARTEV